MTNDNLPERGELLALTSEIVSAYAGNNALDAAGVPELIGSVFTKLTELATGEETGPVELTPAVPIRRSVTDDAIVCVECGRKLKMLKRHLTTDHDLTPEAYRAKWGLKPDYPMVAPNYSAQRKELAKKIGLGRKPRAPVPEPAPEPKKARGRKKAAG